MRLLTIFFLLFSLGVIAQTGGSYVVPTNLQPLTDSINNRWSIFGNTVNLGGNKLGTKNAIGIDVITNNATKMFISTNINPTIGIGTTTPSTLTNLHIKRLTGNNAGITIENDISRRYELTTTMSTSALGANKFAIFDRTASRERIVIDSIGNVGIGTAIPTEKLSIVGSTTSNFGAVVNNSNGSATSKSTILFQNNLNNIGFIALNSSASLDYAGVNSFNIGTANNFPMSLVTNNATRLTVTNLGNVGIGTVAPNSTLDVSGRIGCTITNYATASVTLNNTTSTVVLILAGSQTVTLPSASTNTRAKYTIVNPTATVKTISTYTTLLGTTSTSIPANGSIEIQSDGTLWRQIR